MADVIGRVAPGADPKQIEAHLQVELQQWLLSPIAKLNSEERAVVPKRLSISRPEALVYRPCAMNINQACTF